MAAAIKLGGVAFSLVFAFICCVLNLYTSDLMIQTAKLLENKNPDMKVDSYGALCRESVGNWLFYLQSGITFTMMFFAMCVYAVILRLEFVSVIGDMIGSVFTRGKLLLVGICVFLVLPLCLIKDISKLGFTSIISAVSVVVIILITIVQSSSYHTKMVEITGADMIIVEKGLPKERSIWLCSMTESKASPYSPEDPRFNIYHVENFENLLDVVKKSEKCDDGKVSEVLDEVKEFDGNIKISSSPSNSSYVIAKPQTWSEAVGQAHANFLFSKYSLDPKKNSPVTFLSLMTTIGVFSSAMICQQSTFSIFGQMKRQTLAQWRFVQSVSYVAIYICCMALGLAGYLSQGYQVGESIFEKMKLRFYETGGAVDVPVNVARILLILTIILTFPMQFYFCRKNFFLLYFRLVSRFSSVTVDQNDVPNIYFYIVSTCIFSVVLVIGLFLDAILLVYSLLGSLLAAPLIYIIPTLCYLSINGGLKTRFKEAFKKKGMVLIKVAIAAIVFVFGVFVLFVSTFTTIYTEVNNRKN